MPKMYTVEILIKTRTEREAFKLATTHIGSWSAGGTISEHGKGYFIASDTFTESNLTDEFYEKTHRAAKLAILSDSSAANKRDAILREAEKVEQCLRKLLLHISGTVEGYYDLFKKKDFAKEHAGKESIIIADKLDPITSHLMFGDVIEILGSDLNANRQRLRDINDLAQLLEKSATLDDLRKEIAGRLKPLIVWDVISENLLINPCPWNELKKLLDDLRELRNKAGHFQAIAPKHVKSASILREKILGKIGEHNQKPTSQIDYAKLAGLDKLMQERLSINAQEIWRQAQAALSSYNAELLQKASLSGIAVLEQYKSQLNAGYAAALTSFRLNNEQYFKSIGKLAEHVAQAELPDVNASK